MEKPLKAKKARPARLNADEKQLSALRVIMGSFLVLGTIGAVAGFALFIVGLVFQITNPSGPLNAIFLLGMGVYILPAGALSLISSIGMRQKKTWGRTVAMVVLWPMAVLGALGVVASLVQLQIGAAFLSSLMSAFGWRYMRCLNSKPVRAYFNPSAAPVPSAQVTNG
ncbi:MAG: hypothetical protein Q7T26_11910 [Dehalococcoidia bacterium]|nr:hypothetical protein [Dehalococcoidia bacterium]